jgi:YjbE family integral membrane protein
MEQRRKVIFAGIGAAIMLRIFFALITTQLLAVIGLTLAGGILLLWVCWKMFNELREQASDEITPDEALEAGNLPEKAKPMGTAIWQIVVADVSMSLDNVLAVAGAAQEHPYILAVGLLLSVAMMGTAANLIAHVLHRHRWIGWIGLVIITYVAISMIWRGGEEVVQHTAFLF